MNIDKIGSINSSSFQPTKIQGKNTVSNIQFIEFQEEKSNDSNTQLCQLGGSCVFIPSLTDSEKDLCQNYKNCISAECLTVSRCGQQIFATFNEQDSRINCVNWSQKSKGSQLFQHPNQQSLNLENQNQVFHLEFSRALNFLFIFSFKDKSQTEFKITVMKIDNIKMELYKDCSFNQDIFSNDIQIVQNELCESEYHFVISSTKKSILQNFIQNQNEKTFNVTKIEDIKEQTKSCKFIYQKDEQLLLHSDQTLIILKSNSNNGLASIKNTNSISADDQIVSRIKLDNVQYDQDFQNNIFIFIDNKEQIIIKELCSKMEISEHKSSKLELNHIKNINYKIKLNSNYKIDKINLKVKQSIDQTVQVLLTLNNVEKVLLTLTRESYEDPFVQFKPMYNINQQGNITEFSIARRNGRIATISDSKLITIIGEGVQEGSLQLTTVPLRSFIHPWGQQLQIVFTDRMEVYTILMNGLLLTQTLTFEMEVKLCDISHCGNFLAISDMQTILIQDCINLNLLRWFQYQVEQGSQITLIKFARLANQLLFVSEFNVNEDMRQNPQSIKLMDVSNYLIRADLRQLTSTLYERPKESARKGSVLSEDEQIDPCITKIALGNEVSVNKIIDLGVDQEVLVSEVTLIDKKFVEWKMINILYIPGNFKTCQRVNFDSDLQQMCLTHSTVKSGSGQHLLAFDTSVGRINLQADFNASSGKEQKKEIIPAHSGPLVKIMFSLHDRSVWSLGKDGVLIQWVIKELYANSKDLFLANEFIVGDQYFQDSKNQQNELENKISLIKQEIKEDFLNLKVKLEQDIDLLKKEKHEVTDAKTADIIALQGQKQIEKQILLENSQKTRINLEEDIKQQKEDLSRACDEQDKITSEIKETKKLKEGAGNKHNKELSNNQVTLIKDIVCHYNRKLKTKDKRIININQALRDMNTKYSKYKAESEDLEKNATRAGIEESRNQIKFLQTEVFTCRNKLADEHKNIDTLRVKIEQANKMKQQAEDGLAEKKMEFVNMNEDNVNLDEKLKQMQSELNNIQKNLQHKDQKENDLTDQIIFETNRIQLREQEQEKLFRKFEKAKKIKREHSAEIKKLEEQNKKQEVDNVEFDRTASRTTRQNQILAQENNELESKIKKMKNDIDRALQMNEPAKMRTVILDMCIQYLWNDYIYEENLGKDTLEEGDIHSANLQVKKHSLKDRFSTKTDIIEKGILNIEDQMKRYQLGDNIDLYKVGKKNSDIVKEEQDSQRSKYQKKKTGTQNFSYKNTKDFDSDINKNEQSDKKNVKMTDNQFIEESNIEIKEKNIDRKKQNVFEDLQKKKFNDLQKFLRQDHKRSKNTRLRPLTQGKGRTTTTPAIDSIRINDTDLNVFN